MEPASGDEKRALTEQAFRQASFSMSVFDAEQRYQRLNDMACLVMGVEEAALLGHPFPFGVPADVSQDGTLIALREVVRTGKPVHYESFTRAPSGIREHAWNLELWPVFGESGEVTAVGMAGFDSSEQHWARQRLAVLDAASISLGRSLDLGRIAEELTELIVPRFAEFASVDLFDDVLRGEEPSEPAEGADLVLRRVAHFSTSHDLSVVEVGGTDRYPWFSPPARAIREGKAVLSSGSGDPDFERWMSAVPQRASRLEAEGGLVTSVLAVPLIARGSTLGVTVLFRARTDEFNEDDFTLAKELASRAALYVDNARRYTRERNTALALQASLLPHGPSQQAAVDVAARYQPADTRAGVGGDWFDVIPLSGARVGLVVGDVVGHGIHACATMGRLRTAVQTLADVDLPPDELLAHLDDLVIRLNGDSEDRGLEFDGAFGETGATCLYAVYDPVSRMLTAASAGHPPPVLVLPDGTTRLLDIGVGPVLGVGGLPFEALEMEVPEGSLLALYSDGLVEARQPDPDLGIERLRTVLTDPIATADLDAGCDHILETMLPEHPMDDVALVLARTRALHSDRVAVWDLETDYPVVAEARRLATAQLVEWGLEECSFVTELVVSELVTNALRYGMEPIQLRLIYDRTLICEVSDSNSTSPHLRRARIFDEGGRGLMLVAQLTAKWGTRHTATGKTIWTEQALRPELGR
ncbi:SpoIIE family protein phosphatase [Actinospica sp. MGRD01-02]|uniref:SpoIIE family protein phosphatase n=1 Tax=Actinospica acidithermotolerans TaxID=2828514 RepID=A0A941ENH5_9ACTN|nr:SpoIIE family protein phosphatase [Actinospica acidithermotolerans]MBR7830809.1 SpoIIE family protein phosphatase [Actinospica acidithermotolerans]